MSSEEVRYVKCFDSNIKLINTIPESACEIAVLYDIDIKPGTLFYDTKEQKLLTKQKKGRGFTNEYIYVNSPRVTIFYKDGGSQNIKINYILKYIKETDEEKLHDMSKRKTAKVVFK